MSEYLDFNPYEKRYIETDPAKIKIMHDEFDQEVKRMMSVTGRNPHNKIEWEYFNSNEGFRVLSKDFAEEMCNQAMNNCHAALANTIYNIRNNIDPRD